MKRKARSKRAKRRRGLLHHGLDRSRLRHTNGDLENAFADAWEKQNDRYDSQGDLLRLLMHRGDSPLGWYRMPFEITQRDAVIVATVVQWLGTNCGFAFLTEALEKCNYQVRRSLPTRFEYMERRSEPPEFVRLIRIKDKRTGQVPS
jgi:hypothetical protein